MNDITKPADVSENSLYRTFFIALVWIIGLASTIYLVGSALFLLGLAIIFGFNAPPTHVSDYLAFVGSDAIPVICFAAIGVAGLRFWLTKRFWILGLLAITLETTLAIYVLADPDGMLTLADLPSNVFHWATAKDTRVDPRPPKPSI